MPLPEKDFIQKVRTTAGARAQFGDGIGDDCAVLDLPRGHEALITTDFSLEGIHFRREWHPADSVGHRCLVRGLSDIAAMGGEPRAAFLSLALPLELSQKWADQFLAGLLKLAKRFSIPLAGGDTAQSPSGVLADIVMLGSVPKGKAVVRSGARDGDFIYVTGTLGVSVHTLEQLRQGRNLRPATHLRHFYPEPRIKVGQYLRKEKLASAMIDTSDGLSTDLQHICDESACGAVVYAESVPRLPGSRGIELALHGGEDYELLFTARPDKKIPKKIAEVAVTRIGEIVPGKDIRMAKADGTTTQLRAAGWEHFR